MGIDTQPLSEPLPKNPQSIRELFDQFNSQIGVGQNALFVNAPVDAVFCNWIGNEKPLLYAKDETGKPKRWLTENDLNQIKKDSGEEVEKAEDILFDMFSFMVGGKKPTLTEMGATGWANLLSTIDQSYPDEDVQKVKKVFEFLDSDSKTTLTASISDFVGVTHSTTQKIQTVAKGKSSIVILQGDACYNRGKMYIWHHIRNMRSPVQIASPFRSDGNAMINNVNDVQIGYQTDEGARIVRLNMFVYMLARHGVSEETTEATASDQIYIPLGEYREQIYSQSESERKENQQIENENYVMRNKLDGSEQLQKQRKKAIIDKMMESAKSGGLDNVISSIEQFSSQKS